MAISHVRVEVLEIKTPVVGARLIEKRVVVEAYETHVPVDTCRPLIEVTDKAHVIRDATRELGRHHVVRREPEEVPKEEPEGNKVASHVRVRISPRHVVA